MREWVKIPVEIGGKAGAATGIALDLTEKGISLRVPHQYAVGDRLAVTLAVPRFQRGLDFVAEVRWVDAAGTLDEFLMGCEFVHTPETEEQLRKLIWEISAGTSKPAATSVVVRVAP